MKDPTIDWLSEPLQECRLVPPLVLLEFRRTVSPPGVIGGAVIRYSRRAAGIGRHELAGIVGVDSRTIRDVEIGEIPLYCVPYAFLQRLAEAQAGHGPLLPGGVSELAMAADCDLLLTAMLCDFEDYAEVPPIDQDGPEGDHARGLLRWALRGAVPDSYRRMASPGCLLAGVERIQIAAIAHDLAVGCRGGELREFGHALAMLAIGE